jgi:23S rRNA (adenine2503-C2)-methyltransferase
MFCEGCADMRHFKAGGRILASIKFFSGLFRRFPVELIRFVIHRIFFCRVDDAVAVFGRGIDSIKLHRLISGSIDEIMFCPGRNDDCEIVRDLTLSSVKNRFSCPGFNSNELVKLMDFFADFLAGFQSHNDQLAEFGRIKNSSEIFVLLRRFLYVSNISFHFFIINGYISIIAYTRNFYFTRAMNFDKIDKILEKEPGFRKSQVFRALYKDLTSDWSEATALPKDLREKLEKEVPLEILAEIFSSKDGRTVKAAIKLEDGLLIEAVLMKHNDKRNTVCVSSQVGCPLGCLFCETGKMGLKRNLTSSEIVGQVLFFARLLKDKEENVTNVVFMGMGEPFLNWDQAKKAIEILNDDNCFGIGARKISVSTAGIIEGIENLAREFPQINLAISLHAPDDELRSKLMPINKKYPLEKVLKAVDEYIEKTNRKVMFEYVMIDGVNDSEEQVKMLSKLLKKPLYMVNLIAYNPTSRFKASSPEKIKKFKAILEKEGIFATQRYRFGTDIEAACGQLASTRQK